MCAGIRWLNRSGTRSELAKSRTFTSLPTATTNSCAWSFIGLAGHRFVSWRTNVTTTNTDHLSRGCTCHGCRPWRNLRTWKRCMIVDSRFLDPSTSTVMQSSCSCLMDIHCKMITLSVSLSHYLSFLSGGGSSPPPLTAGSSTGVVDP